jgi:hypothetical protein
MATIADEHKKVMSNNAPHILGLLDEQKISLDEVETLIRENERNPDKVKKLLEEKYLH